MSEPFTNISNFQTDSHLVYPGDEEFGLLTTPRRPKDVVRTVVNKRIMQARQKKYVASPTPPAPLNLEVVGSAWKGWVPLNYNDQSGKNFVNINWKEKPSTPKTPQSPIRTRILYR